MKIKLLASTLFLASTIVNAASPVKPTFSIDMMVLDTNKSAGTILVEQNEYGVVFTPNLSDIPAGLHGFHIHENNSCGTSEKDGKTVLGGAAGGHFDPEKTGQHGFPWTNGNHLGDLPPLYVDMEGNATQPVLAPRVKLSDLAGRSIMIHAGSDNHSDHPKPLGGGGARLVCGVVN